MSVPATDWKERSRMVYQTTRLVISLIVRTGFVRVRAEGQEKVPSSGPAILMINHQSNLDPFLVGWATERPLTMPAKIELFQIPVLRRFIRSLGSFPVDRNTSDSGALRRSLLTLRAGRTLAVFPEGTRSRTRDVGPFGSTLIRLALRERVPVVPVGLSGARDVLPPGRMFPRIGTHVVIRYGTPIDLAERFGSGKVSEQELARATEMVREQVLALVQGD